MNKSPQLHQITGVEILSTFSHNPFNDIHNEPSQKNERKYAKKLCRNAQNCSKVGADGFSSSNTKTVIIIASTASVNAINLSFLITTPCVLKIN